RAGWHPQRTAELQPAWRPPGAAPPGLQPAISSYGCRLLAAESPSSTTRPTVHARRRGFGAASRSPRSIPLVSHARVVVADVDVSSAGGTKYERDTDEPADGRSHHRFASASRFFSLVAAVAPDRPAARDARERSTLPS